jgi:hypothetical protein
MYRVYISNLRYRQQAKKIIFVFLVLTISSSLLSAVAFVTGNLAFASSKKKDDSSGGGGGSTKDKGGGSGGSSDKGGSSDNTGGGGSDNSNGGTSSTDNTATPPPPTTEETTPQPTAAATEQTCPDGSKPDPATGNCPPAATQQKLAPLQTLAPQQTCPDGSAPDAIGNCPPPTNTPVQPQVKQVEVPANPDGSCPEGSFPVGSAGNAGQPGTGSFTCLSNTPPAGRPTDTPPATPTEQKLAQLQTLTPQQQTCKDGSTPDANGKCQDGSTPVETPNQQTTRCAEGTLPTNIPGYCQPLGVSGPSQIEVPANPDGSCPEESYRVGSAGNAGQPGTGSEFCVKNVHVFVNATKLLPGSSTADCTQGTIVVAGKCVPATPPTNTPLAQPPAPKLLGNGVYELPNVPSINNPFAAPSCPSGYHLVRSDRCTADGVSCPSGTVQISEVTCGPQPTPPPAAPPTNTPPAQPQPPQQFAPSQPVCEPGFHWDTSQQECVPNGPK